MKNLFVTFLFSILICLSGQSAFKYRIWLSDKGDTPYSLEYPEAYLSEKAIARREKQNISVDSTDFPVSPVYIDRIKDTGLKILVTSRWLNTVTVYSEEGKEADALQKLPFIDKVECVWRDDLENPVLRKSRYMEKTESSSYGVSYEQIALHNGDKLHTAGYTGSGMTIAVIDAGFQNVDMNRTFDQARIKGTRDFVTGVFDYRNSDKHGAQVLSAMLSCWEGMYMGTAPGADYWLLRSEDNDSEFPVEEDYWTAAIEYADSVGVDIVTSSLGYYTFDDTSMNHCWDELDGRTAYISKAAGIGASKGLLIFSSAGNEGSSLWRKITFPADVESVITVGAISRNLRPAYFTGVGFCQDGRVKPDVTGIGDQTFLISPGGAIVTESGTSFSTPIIAGLSACLWQALPHLSASEMRDVIRKSGSTYSAPDSLRGYGIPDFYQAYVASGTEEIGADIPEVQCYDSGNKLTFVLKNWKHSGNVRLGLYSPDGRNRCVALFHDDSLSVSSAVVPPGIYVWAVWDDHNKVQGKIIKR